MLETIYIEFMEELRIILDEVEKSWWSEWIQKSIDKYKSNKDVSYYLKAFGGMGSFNDEIITSETTNILKGITYNMASQIQKQGTFDFANVLQEEQAYQLKVSESDERHTKGLNYINYITENYSVGNLHQITSEYLEQKTNNNTGKNK